MVPGAGFAAAAPGRCHPRGLPCTFARASNWLLRVSGEGRMGILGGIAVRALHGAVPNRGKAAPDHRYRSPPAGRGAASGRATTSPLPCPSLSTIRMPEGGGAVPRSGMSSGAASRFASLPQQGSGAPGFRALRIPYRYGRPTWTALAARKGYKGMRDALEQCHALACPDRRIYYIRKYGTIQNA